MYVCVINHARAPAFGPGTSRSFGSAETMLAEGGRGE